MARKRRSLTGSLSVRSAKVRRKTYSRRLLHWIGGRGLATLVVGAALSAGGLTEVFQSVDVVIPGTPATGKIARQHASPGGVLASVADSDASVGEPSNPSQDGLVEGSIHFLNKALRTESEPQSNDVFHQEMRRINVALRREFFTNAVPFGDIIHAKAQKYDVDPSLLAAVVETESSFRSHARSQVGARGLMQLMPRTGRWLGARNLYNAEENVDAGAKYLRYLNARFDGNLTKTIAAYNAGEGNVRRYNGIPPFRETRSYVKTVMSRYEKRKRELKQFDDRHAGGVAGDEAMLTLR
ncbi:MAG TPA: lytic transglycosylase domain-containing protein [Thermoanaerobaculia bacterium]|jgi:soluble lytic murein transglycosylase-like protein|nr:lytic transglycosylase domain-containing protein [Thermoanaerobaculia bacterium]